MPENYPHFAKSGERNLLFLKRQSEAEALKDGNAWQVLDGAAGKMRLDAQGNVVALGMSWADVRIELISWLRGARLYLPLLMRSAITNPQETLAPPSAKLAHSLLYDNYDISWPGASPVVHWKLYNPGFGDANVGTIDLFVGQGPRAVLLARLGLSPSGIVTAVTSALRTQLPANIATQEYQEEPHGIV